MTSFALLPAIDLRGGKVVRLQRGDFARETAFSEDPLAVARSFLDGGARWLHVVDLDGARLGRPAHGDVIRGIIEPAGVGARVEIAGGLRTSGAVEVALGLGAARVVVGTAALADPSFAGLLVERHGADRVVVALDVLDGHAVGQAWQADGLRVPLEDAMGELWEVGVRSFEVTAIERDGMLNGPDLVILGQAIAFRPAEIIAAGGIGSVADIRAVRAIGCAGAIVGRALYDGTMDLSSALEAAGDGP